MASQSRIFVIYGKEIKICMLWITPIRLLQNGGKKRKKKEGIRIHFGHGDT